MRDQRIKPAAGGELVVGARGAPALAWIELSTPDAEPGMIELTEGELLMAVDALVMAYGELCGARPDSLARRVNRTLRNRTRAARERRPASESEAA